MTNPPFPNNNIGYLCTTYLEYQMIKEGYQFFGEKERVDIVVE